jgi:hypothetical protein
VWVAKSILLILPIPYYVQLRLSNLFLLAIPPPRTRPSLHDLTVNRSQNPFSFLKCVNYFSMLASRLLVSLVILYGKVLLSLRTATVSQNSTLNSSDAGKVTRLTYTSMNVKSLTLSRESSILMHNSSLLTLLTLAKTLWHQRSYSLFPYTLISYYTIVVWPVETCREISLI